MCRFGVALGVSNSLFRVQCPDAYVAESGKIIEFEAHMRPEINAFRVVFPGSIWLRRYPAYSPPRILRNENYGYFLSCPVLANVVPQIYRILGKRILTEKITKNHQKISVIFSVKIRLPKIRYICIRGCQPIMWGPETPEIVSTRAHNALRKRVLERF